LNSIKCLAAAQMPGAMIPIPKNITQSISPSNSCFDPIANIVITHV
jgi:hypothetical protein